MDRTLYLNETKGMEVLRDGPSIFIKQEGSSGRRVPARLIGRAVIIGNVRLDVGIIMMLTDNNVPVTFMNRKGEEFAVAIPFNHHLPKHYEEQTIFLDKDKNIDAYKRWLFSHRRKCQINTIKRISKSTAEKMMTEGFRNKDYKDFIVKIVAGKEGQFKIIFDIINNFIKTMIIESLIKADIDPHMGVLNRRHNFGLALDICYALEPEADLHCIQFLFAATDKDFMIKKGNNWTISDDGMRDLIHRFENKRMTLHETIESIIDGLFRLMRELRL